jgi:hypothetical protein
MLQPEPAEPLSRQLLFQLSPLSNSKVCLDHPDDVPENLPNQPPFPARYRGRRGRRSGKSADNYLGLFDLQLNDLLHDLSSF